LTWPVAYRRPLYAAPPADNSRLRVLLVEDDPSDAYLVGEYLEEVGSRIEVTLVTSVADARPLLATHDCVLLDLNLPDWHGLETLDQLLPLSNTAICVLTGLEDEHLARAAVQHGAQDYLLKSQVSGPVLTRAIHYAVERRRADTEARRRQEAELRQAESARLERGLLPLPMTTNDAIRIVPFYRAGRQGVLGGDFYDVVQTAPDRWQLLVGDVAGHDVDEAALGVQLRVAWRALVLAGVPDDDILAVVEQVLESERRAADVFATAAMVTLDLSQHTAAVRLAGHPPPILYTDGKAVPIGRISRPVLGVIPTSASDTHVVDLPETGWRLLLYTDGLIEGRIGRDTDDRLGIDRLVDLLARAADRPEAAVPEMLVRHVTELNGAPLDDDVAILLLAPRTAAEAEAGGVR
jgi:serine phosphatase RsbU (regulator of sigma subunit)